MSTNNGQPSHDNTLSGYAPDAPRPASPHPEYPSATAEPPTAHAEPGSVSDHGMPVPRQANESLSAPETRSLQNVAAHPPFVGPANAEPPSAHAEPGSASDHGDDTLASDTAPSYERRRTREHEAHPPFVGSANAEPPSASELRTRSDSEPEHSIDSDHPEPRSGLGRSTIDAYDPDALLHALAVLDFSPAALADQLNLSPFALLDWLESENTQRQLTRYQALERQMLDLRSFKSRRLSIENLEHVLQTTQDLVEKRRTATTLLRLLDRPLTDQRAPTEPKPRSASDRPRSEARPRHPPEPRSQGDQEASSACDESDLRSGSDHGDAPNAIDSHSASGAQSLDHAAQPPFVGSAHAEPPSASELKTQPESELKIQSERELKIQPECEPKNPDANDGPNWDAFFPEAFTGRNGPSAPKPHQRE